MSTVEHEQFPNLTAESLSQPEIIEDLVRKGKTPALAEATFFSGSKMMICYIPKPGLNWQDIRRLTKQANPDQRSNGTYYTDYFELPFATGTMIARRVASALGEPLLQQGGFLTHVINRLPHKQNIIPFPDNPPGR